MQICSPIDRLSEVQKLIDAGADEFFCGTVFQGDHFAVVRMSGDPARYCVPTPKELELIVAELTGRKKRLFVVANSIFLNRENKDKVKKFFAFLKRINVTGVIVSSIELISVAQEHALMPVASSLFEVKNAAAANMLHSLGAQRIILDRQITCADLKNIGSMCPALETEVFILGAGCRSLDGYCHPERAADRKGYIHPCFNEFRIEPTPENRRPLAAQEQNVIAERMRMPRITCGACALNVFRRHGVHALKIVGRGYSLERKIRNIVFVREAMQKIADQGGGRRGLQAAREQFKKHFEEDCFQQYCYYPHFSQPLWNMLF